MDAGFVTAKKQLLAEFFSLRDNSANQNFSRIFFSAIRIFSDCRLGVFNNTAFV